MGLTSVCESAQNCDRENQKKQCCYIKRTDRWYLDLVVKYLRCISTNNHVFIREIWDKSTEFTF